jgi:hypothetical protein
MRHCERRRSQSPYRSSVSERSSAGTRSMCDLLETTKAFRQSHGGSQAEWRPGDGHGDRCALLVLRRQRSSCPTLRRGVGPARCPAFSFDTLPRRAGRHNPRSARKIIGDAITGWPARPLTIWVPDQEEIDGGTSSEGERPGQGQLQTGRPPPCREGHRRRDRYYGIGPNIVTAGSPGEKGGPGGTRLA